MIAALLIALAGQPAPPLGRLFFSPAEREQLDSQRAGGATPATPQAATTPAPPPPPTTPVTVTGILRRSGGSSVVWVDHTQAQLPVKVAQRIASAVVTLPDGRRVKVKPGQSVDPASGEVHDVRP